MEIAWEGRPCADPRGAKVERVCCCPQNTNDKVGNICFLHHTHISKENPSKPKLQSWQHFIAPKPTFPSWRYLSPPNPNIKVEKTCHPRPRLKVRRMCFLHKPKLRSWKYSVVHQNQTYEVGCPPKTLISMCRF